MYEEFSQLNKEIKKMNKRFKDTEEDIWMANKIFNVNSN